MHPSKQFTTSLGSCSSLQAVLIWCVLQAVLRRRGIDFLNVTDRDQLRKMVKETMSLQDASLPKYSTKPSLRAAAAAACCCMLLPCVLLPSASEFQSEQNPRLLWQICGSCARSAFSLLSSRP